MEQTDNFWMATATVLPVLGLALLVVARIQVRQLVDSQVALSILGIALVPTMLGLPFVVVVSLVALVGATVPDWIFVASLVVFAAATSLLFLLPAIWMMRAVFAPLDWESRVVLWQIRYLLWQRRRLIRRHRRLGRSLVLTSTANLLKAAELLDAHSRGGDNPARQSAVAKLRAEQCAEARKLELIAQELVFMQAFWDEGVRRASKLSRRLGKETRNAAALVGWGVFSGSIGHEGIEQAKDEAKRRASEAAKLIKAELDLGRSERSEVWTNLQHRPASN